MKQRGRPKTSDILTPREWEVLELLRQSRSNPEIAATLGISLSGAKHHVSEILAKLSVTTREEAAAHPIARERRWSVFPLALLSTLTDATSGLLAPKLAAAALASLALFALGAGLLVARGSITGGSSSENAVATTPTPVLHCPPPQCQRSELMKYTTLEQAVAQASFVPALPSYIPAGYTAYEVTHGRFPGAPKPIDRSVHNDWVTVYYRNASGSRLVVEQGFPSMLGVVAFPSPDGANSLARAESKGVVEVKGRHVYWLKAEGWPPGPNVTPRAVINDPALGKSGGIVLAWEVGRFGPGWAISPDRSEVLTGSPFSYSVAADVLPLSELMKVAESVVH